MARLLRRDDYTVGWVCALPVELAAAQEMLDEEHETPPYDTHDTNIYTCGRVGEHNVVIACLPEGQTGTNSAAAVAVYMKSTFPSTRFGLLVGIGGGVPSDDADVRLGDVVVSKPHNTHGGVVQYDSGKATPRGFERTGVLNIPPMVLLNAIANVRAKQIRGKGKLMEYLSKLESLHDFSRDAAGPDVLFETDYEHVERERTCMKCSKEHIVPREARRQEVLVHYGIIASGNLVMRSAAERDRASAELGGVLCFEMEAAGLMNSFPCLVVRGVCDYADSHKNKRWQAYAAGTAAAYAKEVLSVIPPTEVAESRTVQETTGVAYERSSEHSPSPFSKRRRLEWSALSGDTVARQEDIAPFSKTVVGQMNEPTADPAMEQGCLRSLSFLEQEYRIDDVHTAVDTCEWLLEDTKYHAWMKATTGLFWIKGDPGAGKSVLMKHCIKRMRQCSPNDLVVSFFFHGQGTPLQKTLLGLFRALLASMLEHFPEHLTQLAVKFAEREKRYGSFGERRWEWTEKELQELLSSVLSKGTHARPVVIFIDALDECGEHPAKNLLAYFKDLMAQAEGGNACFRICLSSRHYPILALDTISSVQVEERNIQDIRRYIQKELRDIRPKSKREQIETEILSKSNGGFQWAFLVTRTIVDKNLTGIKAEKLVKELNSCPRTLGEIYEAILDSVPRTEQHQMAKLFQWVRFAERPLSAQELREALATDQDMTHRTISKLRAYEGWSDSLADFERHVKHISRGLIRFQSRELWEQYDPNGEDSDREAQLIHQSVADFLVDKFVNSGRIHGPMVQSSAGPSHFQISRSCLRYMTLEEILENAHLPRNTLSSKYPLAPYAVRFLFAHIKKVELEGVYQTDLLSVMQWLPDSETMRKLATLWRTLDPDSIHTPLGWPFIRAKPLHVLVALGSMSAIDVLFESGCDDIDCRDADGNTPLMLAIREGHQNIALALLRRSIESRGRHEHHDNGGECRVRAPPFSRAADIDAQNQDGDTALNIALEQRMGKAILGLIEAGADLKYLGRESALVAHAISSRDEKLLSMLIEKEVDLDGAVYFAVKDQPPQRDLVLERIITKLLDAGADTARSLDLNEISEPWFFDDEFEDDMDDTDALAIASRRGLTEVVEILLSYNAPATLPNHYAECPLLIAVKGGHGNVVKLLLQRAPSSVEMADDDGETPFGLAIGADQAEITMLLLQGGSFSATNSLLKVCFHDAVQGGATDVLEVMLQRKLVDEADLCLAVFSRDEAVVKLLLETDKVNVDVNAKDNNGETPLLLAARNGDEDIIKLLLNAKVDVNAKNNSGETPLSLATREGDEDVIKLLLDAKVDVNAKDRNG
ncbi:hypothetical protein BKA63DRAFT_544167, partial [Paraphoma chrysanthemicola]